MEDPKKTISGFSKLSKTGKIKWIVENFFKNPEAAMKEMISFWHTDTNQQKILDGFSENTLSNYPMPYGVAPNFIINGKTYVIPMVIEESSVVAAAASAAKFWMNKGGFKAEVKNIKKTGQVHFLWPGPVSSLFSSFNEIKVGLLEALENIERSMQKRGGGILDIKLLHKPEIQEDLFHLFFEFDTRNSMGANFINSVLERAAESLSKIFAGINEISDIGVPNILMSILSNYTPECIVSTWVECTIDQLGEFPNEMSSEEFARRFELAVNISLQDEYRAVTHNKGIFNGIDAVLMATANDFRAIEASAHAYASKDGKYRGLSYCKIENGSFRFSMDLPMAIGTVGGLTNLHPLAKHSFELLGYPDSQELMQIIAVAGLAQNFAAIRSLVTTGIQKGHMKMHLGNILHHLKATDSESEAAVHYFEDKTVSFSSVREFVHLFRNENEVNN
jgi:hydroxymethylglutaryl-CoA reductase